MVRAVIVTGDMGQKLIRHPPSYSVIYGTYDLLLPASIHVRVSEYPPRGFPLMLDLRRATQRVWCMLAVSASLYALSTGAWALDVSVLWLEVYRLLPSRSSVSALDMPINDALPKLDGPIKAAHDACEVITVSREIV